MTNRPPTAAVVRTLLARHGRTFAEEAAIGLRREVPSALFRLLCLSLLLSARIRHEIAVDAYRALTREGLTSSARKMAGATWEQRVRTLNRSGYARYDGRTSTMLGETSELLIDRWGGDLRRLRAEADRDPAAERRLLKQFKGIGDVGVDIFFREVQLLWPELFPFVDGRALRAATTLGLGSDGATLACLVPKQDFPRLVAALVRFELRGGDDELLAEAR